ncbi:hypothetical protein ACVWZ6_006200 [Bradyrhizobium sp. GM6.1]
MELPKVALIYLNSLTDAGINLRESRHRSAAPAGRLGASRELDMIKSLGIATFAFCFAVSAQAMTPAPIAQPESLVTEVAAACGVGRTRINGVVRSTDDGPSYPSGGPQMCERNNVLIACPSGQYRKVVSP